jgi:hypothetical protein
MRQLVFGSDVVLRWVGQLVVITGKQRRAVRK